MKQLVLAKLVISKCKITGIIYIHIGLNEWMKHYTGERERVREIARETHTHRLWAHTDRWCPAVTDLWVVFWGGRRCQPHCAPSSWCLSWRSPPVAPLLFAATQHLYVMISAVCPPHFQYCVVGLETTCCIFCICCNTTPVCSVVCPRHSQLFFWRSLPVAPLIFAAT